MYSLPRLRLCTAQQPIATSALLVYLCVVGCTVLYLAMQTEGTDAGPELRAGSSAWNGSAEAAPAAASAVDS